MFEPLSYREISAETMREHMLAREYSDDPDIRDVAHFEGYMSPEMFHRASVREIEEDDVAAMKKIGYLILEFGKFNWEMVVDALMVFKQVHGHVNVPYDYIIDQAELDKGYSYRFEDMPLGDYVEGIRIGDVDGLEDPERRQILDDLGFDWGDKTLHLRLRFYPMILGLKVYRHLYEFPLPPYDFVVPDEEQWPYWMCGMPLGEWVTVCRIQQKLIDQHYPDRKDMLHAMEFIWWIPPGPINPKYYEPLP